MLNNQQTVVSTGVDTLDNNLFHRVMNLDLSKVKARMVKKQIKEETAEAAIKQFKRFFWLAGTQSLYMVPTKSADEVWHEFILFTKDYAETCENLFGKFIHHKPATGKAEEVAELNISFDVTASIYKQMFGDDYGNIALQADCCDGSNGCHTCSGQTCCSTP